MSDNRDIGYAAFGFFFGIWSFFWGFKRLRRKRLIENIPTSTVRGLAMGLVEVKGKAKPTTALQSPLTKTKCVLYQYLIEEYRRSGKSGHWVKIASGNSFYCPFWLDDGTGKIMVLPSGTEIICPHDFRFVTGLGKTLPSNLIDFLDANAIRYRNWIGHRQLRFTEWYICEDEEVYVLGTAKKKEGAGISYKEKLTRRLGELKSSPEKMKDVDLNKDGKISIEEWDRVVKKLEQEALEEVIKSTSTENAADVIIGKGDVETMFMISDRSEKELVGRLWWESLLGIYGGAGLSLACLAYLLFRLRTLIF